MQISELADHAAEKYNIREQHKWADFPGFSVLSDPDTGKWVALLMRQWDSESGTELERADIKCGRELLSKDPKPFMSVPFRMHGPKWTGITFGPETDREVVFQLFDQALKGIAPAKSLFSSDGNMIVLDSGVLFPASELKPGKYQDTPITGPDRSGGISDRNVPEVLRHMLSKYEYGDGSFLQKCRNFYEQGLTAVLYTDDQPWYGDLKRYFPTYHDLNLKQLRGYFTWRTGVRSGQFRKTCSSFAYIYLYELLNGIGTDSPEDSLRKMEDFQEGYIDTGMGDPAMKTSLRRWMMEFAVIYDFPKEVALAYAPSGTEERDKAISVLRAPEDHDDDTLLNALLKFSSARIRLSPVLEKQKEKAAKLFAGIWRHLLRDTSGDEKNIFERCFGTTSSHPWHPLANAVYLEHRKIDHSEYILNSSRRYICENGSWTEEYTDPLTSDSDSFMSLMHVMDMRLRKIFKTGYYLRHKDGEEWAEKLVDQALQEIKEEAEIAARPKVEIDVSGLGRIRNDAAVTRDSLLTEEEMQAAIEEIPEETQDAALPAGLEKEDYLVLTTLLSGGSPDAHIQKEHLMPSVIADRINEAFFDDIGDTVIECENDRLALVPDYIEDLQLLIGGN